MTELSFLLELLMEHRLEKRTKIMLKNRIAEIQVQIPQNIPNTRPVTNYGPVGTNQAPSMQRAIAEMEQGSVPHGAPVSASPAAQQALIERQKLINQAISGQEEKGRSSPRKF